MSKKKCIFSARIDGKYKRFIKRDAVDIGGVTMELALEAIMAKFFTDNPMKSQREMVYRAHADR